MGASRKPVITERVVARVDRPAARNTAAASLLVVMGTVEPQGAPSHVRPRYAVLRCESLRVTSIAIRRKELAAVIAGLQEVARELGVDVPG